ncbi:MAG: energy transducer TonB [Gemmatimonadetes bacterium]|nr:energy transducer TonB [Gemmatimonadota bacterium]
MISFRFVQWTRAVRDVAAARGVGVAPVVPLVLAVALVTACDRGAAGSGGMAVTPDSLPVFIGDSLPFDYPPGPYIQRIQDNVTLRLYLDEFGRPVPDSTRIHEHATVAAFDTSALDGSKELVFRPAMKDGKAIPFPVLFPIKFRVPDGPPMPGDSGAPVPKH